MRAVLQRVTRASVTVDGEVLGKIGKGFMILLGVENSDTEEITDRFVRGDVSRKTEGSGLGLAIAKSFTELQGGTLRILTDADLFKVEIVFPCMKEGTDGRTEQNESDK